jgi:uncharacterized protein (DUF302 family)
MKKSQLVYGLGGIVLGIFVTFMVIYMSAQSVMMNEEKLRYNFEDAVELFEKTTLEKGWKIPAVHDLQATMTKFGKEVRKIKVFELCHPEHAYEILSRDKERIVSSLMPCRVSIYEKSDGKVYISWMNTGLMGKMMEGVVPEVMEAASRESEEIIFTLLGIIVR